MRTKAWNDLVAVVLEELDRERLLAVHEEGEGVATSREIGLVAEKLVDVVRNVAHKTISMQLVDRIAWGEGVSWESTM